MDARRNATLSQIVLEGFSKAWLFDDHRDADRTSELYLANQRDP